VGFNRPTFFLIKECEMPRRILTGRLTANQELALKDGALNGDIILQISPATTTRPATAAGWTRNVTITAVNSSGVVHSWLSQTFAAALAVATTSVAGAVSIASPNLTMVDGRAVVTITGTAAAWLALETNTLTVGNLSILGYTVTGGTSVETITA